MIVVKMVGPGVQGSCSKNSVSNAENKKEKANPAERKEGENSLITL